MTPNGDAAALPLVWRDGLIIAVVKFPESD
jgi:hypothetical protein